MNVVVLLAVAGMLSGCGGNSSARTTTAAAAPTTVQTATARTTTARTTTAGTTTSAAVPGPCAGIQLAGVFAAIHGSAGAGNISYALTLKNTSSVACTLRGLPTGRLLDPSGGVLPTNIQPEKAGQTAPHVRLRPGASARATARFSPDVPGTGEQVTGRCEAVAGTLRVTAPGGGTTKASISPATSVCEHGRMFFSAYALKRTL